MCYPEEREYLGFSGKYGFKKFGLLEVQIYQPWWEGDPFELGSEIFINLLFLLFKDISGGVEEVGLDAEALPRGMVRRWDERGMDQVE